MSAGAPTAVFRADADRAIGGGHVVRCLALADALAARGFRTAFATRRASREVVPALGSSGVELLDVGDEAGAEPARIAARWPGGIDLLVVDHYGRDAVFEQAARAVARHVMVVDDLLDRRHDADLLLDQNLGRETLAGDDRAAPACRRLYGARYALLRPQFAAAREASLARRAAPAPVRRVFVSLGAGDNAAVESAVLASLPAAPDVDVVGGGAGTDAGHDRPGLCRHRGVSDMASLMAVADVAVCAAGVTVLELCALGVPAVVLVTADNQRQNGHALQAAGAALVLDAVDGVDATALGDAVAALVGEADLRARCSERAAALCDGGGAARAAAAVAGLVAAAGATQTPPSTGTRG